MAQSCGATQPGADRFSYPFVITNAEPTQFDEIAYAKLTGLICDDLPRICGRFDAA